MKFKETGKVIVVMHDDVQVSELVRYSNGEWFGNGMFDLNLKRCSGTVNIEKEYQELLKIEKEKHVYVTCPECKGSGNLDYPGCVRGSKACWVCKGATSIPKYRLRELKEYKKNGSKGRCSWEMGYEEKKGKSK